MRPRRPSWKVRTSLRDAACATLAALFVSALLFAQEPAGPQSASPAALAASIAKLGDLDYTTRTNAARSIRRTAAAQAVPALLQAVAEHADGYVRYRALVLLTGFNDPRTRDAMRESLSSPNDRLRTVAYSFYEHNPERELVPTLLSALEREQAEFVRPALVRALAAHASQFDEGPLRAVLTRETGRGEDFFRSVVIEALGDYKAAYAFDAVTGTAKVEGPLQDDSALALGRIGEKRALETLAGLQRTAPRTSQPSIAAGICLLGVNCESHEGYLIETLKFADSNIGFQELLRGTVRGLTALALAGRPTALSALYEAGIPSRDPTRAPVALALATIALRNTPLMLKHLEADPPPAALSILAEGFDMLEEDLEKERFFAGVRRRYWSIPEGAAARDVMQRIIGQLDF